MAVYIDRNTRLLVQGLTGRKGTFHAKAAQAYGTNVVGGVTPGKGGTTHEGWPVFNTVADAGKCDWRECVGDLCSSSRRRRRRHGSRGSRTAAGRVHHRRHPDARHDGALTIVRARGMRLIGPNCPGLITAGQAKAGIIPGNICKPGRVGIVSKSGTLTYQAIHQFTRLELGQTTCIGIGGDPLIGTSFIDALG